MFKTKTFIHKSMRLEYEIRLSQDEDGKWWMSTTDPEAQAAIIEMLDQMKGSENV
jgi:hypothetical protein